MHNRWSILALLFAIRATMALQFQSIASVAPLLERDFGVDLADIGILIGLYFAPGIALALAGGAIGQRFGGRLHRIKSKYDPKNFFRMNQNIRPLP
jgi:MFS family permease